jgi:GH15 family glucan-1,4-alpha-glucosidase
VRGDAAHHVHSKLMAWLAIDRGLRIGARHRLGSRRRARWIAARAAIAAEIAAQGVDSVRGAYLRSYGSADLDAAVLAAPLVEVEPAAAHRACRTIDAIRAELGAGGPLLYRYPPGRDGLAGGEGAFLPCSFWLVRALALTGQRDEARRAFEAMLERASPLGLYGEEMDPATGAHLGNFPQALTHSALVGAALALQPSEPSAAGPEPSGGRVGPTGTAWLCYEGPGSVGARHQRSRRGR